MGGRGREGERERESDPPFLDDLLIFIVDPGKGNAAGDRGLEEARKDISPHDLEDFGLCLVKDAGLYLEDGTSIPV